MKRPTFEEACAKFVHRFTMEHVPSWATLRPVDSGGTEARYYAPQFRTDREWYNNTLFPGEVGYLGVQGACYTSGQTWPLGQWLDKPYDPNLKTFKVVATIAVEFEVEGVSVTEISGRVRSTIENCTANFGEDIKTGDPLLVSGQTEILSLTTMQVKP